MAVIERIREKWFRAIVAFGPYSKGALLKPTGIYRQTLLAKRYIEEVKEDPIPNASFDDEPRSDRQVLPDELQKRKRGRLRKGA